MVGSPLGSSGLARGLAVRIVVPVVSRCLFGRRGDGLGASRPGISRKFSCGAKAREGSPEAAPNIFKSSRATLQKVLSGGTNRPIVEEAAHLSTELGYNPLEMLSTDFDRKRTILSHPFGSQTAWSQTSIATLPAPSLRSDKCCAAAQEELSLIHI